jgi:tetratricopeptide (TPR) repeat protein
MAEELFESLRDRILGYLDTGITDVVLAPATLIDAARLMLSADDRIEPRFCTVVGTLHWARLQHLGEAARQADHDAAICLFTVVHPLRPWMVPEPLRSAFDRRPPQVQPAHEILNAVGAALTAECRRTGERDLLEHAILLFRRAVAVAPWSDPSLGAMELNLGFALSVQFDFTRDVRDLGNAIDTMRRGMKAIPREHPKRGPACSDLANALQTRFKVQKDLTDLDEAVVALRDAVRAYAVSAGAVAVWFQLGAAQVQRFLRTRRQEDLEEAVGAFNTGLARTPAGHPRRWKFLSALGDTLLMRHGVGDSERAITVLEEALAETGPDRAQQEEMENALQAARSLQAKTVMLAREVEAAHQMLEQALTTASEISVPRGAPADLARSLSLLGHSLPGLRARGDQAGEAASLRAIGLVYSVFWNKGPALAFHERALAIFRELGDRAGEATSLSNIGCIHSDLGLGARALAFFEQALPLFRAAGDRSGEATVLNNMGGVHRAQGEYDRALSLCEEALSLRRAVGDRNGEAGSLNDIAGIRGALGDHVRALSLHEQALPICRSLGARAGEARTLLNIGRVHRALGDRACCLSSFDEALPIFRAVGDRAGEALTLSQIAMLHDSEGNTEEAITLLERVVGLGEEFQLPDLELDRAALAYVRAKRPVSTIAYPAARARLLCPCGSGASFLECHGQNA